MSTPLRSKEKRLLFAHLLESGITALHLDGRHAGVRVPARFRKDAWVVLNYSYNYHIADFRFDDEGIEASLSFSGQPYPCYVPWEAVFAITDKDRKRGRVWEEDLPAEALAGPGDPDASASSEGRPGAGAGKKRGPSLQVLPGGQGEEGSEGPTPPPTPPPRGGHLRRVK